MPPGRGTAPLGGWAPPPPGRGAAPPDPGADVTVPWGLLVAIEAPPDPLVIGPRAPSKDDAVGFGAARGECFGGPRITPRITTKAAITAAAPATANVAAFPQPCQSR